MESSVIYSPFQLNIAKMKHLFLINIEKDPDKIYTAFEPQSFDDPLYGEIIRIIAYRKDGYLDFYQQKGTVKEKDKDLSGVGKGLGDFVEVEMEKSKFEITERGVDVHFIFTDKLGRKIVLKIKENNLKHSKAFDLLAPIGVSSDNPQCLPVFWMYEFCFVKRKGTEVIIQIADKNHEADKFPMPMDGKKIYFMRYSKNPVIGEWNTSVNGDLESLKIEGNKAVSKDGVVYHLQNEEDSYSIKSMSLDGKKSGIKVEFIPPIKDIRTLQDNEENSGQFIISGDESIGTIGGDYTISKEKNNVRVTAIPSNGWKPNESRLIIKLIYLVKIFKNWPKTYKWTADIKIDNDKAPNISSSWERIE